MLSKNLVLVTVIHTQNTDHFILCPQGDIDQSFHQVGGLDLHRRIFIEQDRFPGPDDLTRQ